LVTCLSEDLWTCKNVLKYDTKICEIFYFDQRIHFKGLSEVSKILTAYKIGPKMNQEEFKEKKGKLIFKFKTFKIF
jgi:hypothetical protein